MDYDGSPSKSSSSKSNKSSDSLNSLLNQDESYTVVSQNSNEAGPRIRKFDIAWIVLATIFPLVI